MFQIAAVIGYARQYGLDYVLPPWEYAKHFSGDFKPTSLDMNYPKYQERTFHYTKVPRMPRVDLYGYFQSRMYWKHCEAEIKKLFAPAQVIQDILDKTPIEGNCCAIHIRRGDYLKIQDYHRVLPIEYYRDAVKAINADSYIVLCEDAEYVKEFIANLGIESIARHQASGNDLLDWFIARQHTHHIIANSSYSWWWSYLSDKEGKRVIAPNKTLWFGPKYKQNNVTDLYLQEWQII